MDLFWTVFLCPIGVGLFHFKAKIAAIKVFFYSLLWVIKLKEGAHYKITTDCLARISCGLRCVKSDFYSPQPAWKTIGPPRFRILNIKHVQYLPSEILLCGAGTQRKAEHARCKLSHGMKQPMGKQADGEALKSHLTSQDLEFRESRLVVGGQNPLVFVVLCWSSRSTPHAVRTKLWNLPLLVIMCGLTLFFIG